MLEWDGNKAAENLTKHGIAFDLAERFEWSTAVIEADERTDYGERRLVGTGKIDNRLYVMVFVVRADVIRIVSLRKANRREIKRYDQ